MNIILLTPGLGGGLSVQHLRHQIGFERPATASTVRVHLLLLDAREMDDACYQAACAEVATIRAKLGLNLGVLICGASPAIGRVVAAIRCGLLDVINQYVSAAHLRQILRVACPDLRLAQFDGVVSLLRTLGGLSGATSSAPAVDIARKEEELDRRRADLTALERQLGSEKEAISLREQDLRERVRRFDRQLARLQNDIDAPAGATNSPAPSAAAHAELAEAKKRLDQRAAELDLREKMLAEMQELITAQAGLPGAGR